MLKKFLTYCRSKLGRKKDSEHRIAKRYRRNPLYGLSVVLLGLTAIFSVLIFGVLYLVTALWLQSWWVREKIENSVIILTANKQLSIAEVIQRNQRIIEDLGIYEIHGTLDGRAVPRFKFRDYDNEKMTRFNLDRPFLNIAKLPIFSDANTFIVEASMLNLPRTKLSITISSREWEQLFLRFSLSLGISLLFVIVVMMILFFFTARKSIVKPINHIINRMRRFSSDPVNVTTILIASDRKDEIGILQRELTRMQVTLRVMLKRHQHLASLGASVAKVNHDLKGVLSAVMVMGESMSESSDPLIRRKMPLFISSLERSISLCSRILVYVGQSKQPTYSSRVNVSLLLVEVRATIKALVQDKADIIIEDRHEGELLIEGDKEELQRSLENLLRNAIEAGADLILINTDISEKSVYIAIKDNGPGLPKKIKDNLFTPFLSGSPEKGGSGLGLSIAHELIAQHSGELTLINTDTKGTEFRIWLPIADGVVPKIKTSENFANPENPENSPSDLPSDLPNDPPNDNEK